MMSLVQYHDIIRDGKELFQTGQLQQLQHSVRGCAEDAALAVCYYSPLNFDEQHQSGAINKIERMQIH